MEMENYRTISKRVVTRDDDTLEEDSEKNLVATLEERSNITKTNMLGWDDFSEADYPPLESKRSKGGVFFSGKQNLKAIPEIFSVVKNQIGVSNRSNKAIYQQDRKLAFMKKMASMDVMLESSSSDNDVFVNSRRDHVDGKSLSHIDNFVESAIKVNQVMEKEAPATKDPPNSRNLSLSLRTLDDTSEPLLPTITTKPNVYSYGSSESQDSWKYEKKIFKADPINARPTPYHRWWTTLTTQMARDSIFVKKIVRFLIASSFTFLVFPCIVAAALIFYYMGNPSVGFLPGNATLSWWLIFVARQALIFECSFIIEYITVECIALGTRWMVWMCGPLITLWFINAKGWPLILILWSLLDLALLHGESRFQQNWLYFLNIELFSPANNGGQILVSDLYLRTLLSVLLAGTCHAIKRTHVAMVFGRRIFITYKTSLEQILADIVLISEVSELAAELNASDEPKTFSIAGRIGSRLKNLLDIDYESTVESKNAVDFDKHHAHDFNDESPESIIDDEESVLEVTIEPNDSTELEKERSPEKKSGNVTESLTSLERSHLNHSSNSITSDEKKGELIGRSLNSTDCSVAQLYQMLDRWQEPQNKLEKTNDVSISDILKFRKALAYMDDPYPFGRSFGPGGSRSQIIHSSRALYLQLIRSSDLSILSFDVLKSLAIKDNGELDHVKVRAIRRLFRPDNQSELSLLAFVQSCDGVYKKLRYFRASVANASVINTVLESIVDGLVNFFLALIIMTILEYNPYPLLVSISTILVSLAFAVGSSASKYIEGILLIAFRRPFDIGDRIVISEPSQDESGGTSKSWFVEDINLWCTTLRFAATNEVAMVNNGTLSALRITNCNRSPKAMISLNLEFALHKVNEQKITFFRSEIEKYVRERPRTFDTLMLCRCEHMDASKDLAQYSIRVRHMKSWQDAPLILHNRGELVWFCQELGKELGINKEQVPIQVATVANDLDVPNKACQGAVASVHILELSSGNAATS